MIIGLAGKKQSGKSTLANFLHGHQLMLHDVIDKFSITKKGELVVDCTMRDSNGKLVQDSGVLDLNQKNDYFFEYASQNIWPIIKLYSFADALKELCISLLGLLPEQVYGTDEQKNSIVPHLLWENMPGVYTNKKMFDLSIESNPELSNVLIYHKPGPMTGREVMQYVGTDIFRRIYGRVWINALLNMVEAEGSGIAIVSDVRFGNEADAILGKNGYVIGLTRSIYDDSHLSENDLKDYGRFSGIIDNQKMEIAESCEAFLDLLVSLKVTRRILHKAK